MAIVGSHEASSSTLYDVFLSFRCEDTGKNFTDHLYTALVQQGFRTFRDDKEFEMDEYQKSELEKAICQSKISIVVISKDYTSSTECLDELVMILERRTISRHVVLPIFYDVDSSQIRKQTGRTAEALARYEEQFEAKMDSDGKRKLMEKIKRWRSALTEVADLVGLDLQNQVDGHESTFIKKIIKVIGDKLSRTALDVGPCIVGINSRVKDINMWLQDGSTDVRVRAICGMGGIGKTTIAKFVYNQNYDNFDSSSFLANIKEASEQPNGLLCLQRQLLSDISRRKQGKIHNVDEGLAKIKNIVRYKKVLVILDDVEEVDQIYAVLGMQDWLFRGSKVIITSRYERLLKPHQIFRVDKLGQGESIKLFSLHAFGEDCPIESYIKHTERAVQICEGLPLALKVIGSSLSGKSEDEWISELAKLEAIPHNQILRKLKISYDSLQDDYDKTLFLHTACFFVGTSKDYAIKILEKCDLHAKIGIKNLIDRCLLTNYGDNMLGMHRLIQDMGREIVHQESHEAGERSRLWHYGDSLSVLKNETGTKTIEGLILDMHMLKDVGNNAKKRRYEEFRDKSILSKHVSSLKQRCSSFISRQSKSRTLRSSNDVDLRTDAFKNMTKLKLLQLNYVHLTGSYENLPKSLVQLCWHGFPLKSIPVKFSLENLVALDLRHSRLEQVWNETPFLGSLKILDLGYSERLTRTPNFLGLPNLERLILKGCVSLVEVSESIGNLEMLEFVDLQNCRTLAKLPRNIGKLGSLKTLIISGCNIGEFPSEMRNMKSLKVLNADGIVINALHNSSGEVKWWQHIVWSRLPTPKKGPQTLWASLPCSLRELSISGCNLFDESFPVNFGDLRLLTRLDLSNNTFQRLPNCIRSLSGLNFLDMSQCHKLQSLDLNGVSINSGFIDVQNCTLLEKVTPVNEIGHIWLYGCNKLVELNECFKKEPTTRFDFTLGMFEYGIFSMFFGHEEIPRFLGEKCEGSSIHFVVPWLSTHTRTQCMYAWCLFQRRIDIIEHFDHISVKIENKTKDLTWIYTPNYIQFDESIGWLSRWRFGNQMESGDEITIMFNGNEYEAVECGFKFGYLLVLEEEEGNGSSSSSSSPSSSSSMEVNYSHHDFSALRLSTGEYFLNSLFEENHDEDYWFPKDCSEPASLEGKLPKKSKT
ncbi:hypothetical protein LguiA_021802 [Lonicera macranthoides]